MSEDDLVVRVFVGLELLAFLVVLGCCAIGVRHAQARFYAKLIEFGRDGPPVTPGRKFFRILPPDERHRRRAALRPIIRDMYFWGFFAVLDCVMLWTFWETLPI